MKAHDVALKVLQGELRKVKEAQQALPTIEQLDYEIEGVAKGREVMRQHENNLRQKKFSIAQDRRDLANRETQLKDSISALKAARQESEDYSLPDEY